MEYTAKIDRVWTARDIKTSDYWSESVKLSMRQPLAQQFSLDGLLHLLASSGHENRAQSRNDRLTFSDVVVL